MIKPKLYTTEQILSLDCKAQIIRGGRVYWTPARPISTGKLNIRYRLKISWLVFVGKYDALEWIEK